MKVQAQHLMYDNESKQLQIQKDEFENRLRNHLARVLADEIAPTLVLDIEREMQRDWRFHSSERCATRVSATVHVLTEEQFQTIITQVRRLQRMSDSRLGEIENIIVDTLSK